MILRRLAIERLPGIREGFDIELAGQGIQVVHGPNGIGKSSLCRAVEALYWADRGPARQTSLSAEFELNGETWRAEREASSLRWTHGGSNASPHLPKSRHRFCFFLRLRDLIDPSSAGTEDVATEIRRQMAGGVNLRQVGATLGAPPTPRAKGLKRRAYNEARDKVDSKSGEHAALQKRADKLERLAAQLQEAETSERRLTHVDRAIDLAIKHVELAEAERSIATMPDALANLTGRELDEVLGHRKMLSTYEKRARSLGRDRRDARTEQRASGLEITLDDAVLTAWQNRADNLVRLEDKLGRARNELESVRAELSQHLEAVGSNLVDNAGLTLPNHAELFDFLRTSHELEACRTAVEEKLRLLDVGDTAHESAGEFDRIRDGIDALRRWLRTPNPESFAARLRARWPRLLIVLLPLAAFLAIVSLTSVALSLAAIGGVAAGLCLAALLAWNGDAATRRRSAAKSAFEETGLEEPADWTIRDALSRLRELERIAANVEAIGQRARERKGFLAECEVLDERGRDVEARRKELAATLGLDDLSSDADLVDYARALDQLRRTCGGHAAQAGRVEELDRRHAERIAALAEFVEQYGEPRPADAAAGQAALKRLSARNERLRQALEREATAVSQLEQNDEDQQRTLDTIAAIYASAGVDDGDEPELVAMLELRPEYRELRRSRDSLASKIELLESDLGLAGETSLAEMDGRSLERLKSDLKQEASCAGELRDEIADINARVKLAREGTSMANLIADREAARDELRDLRDQALSAMAGKFLLDEIEEEFELTQMPRVFERARAHFTAFTRHGYELKVASGDSAPRLYAQEAAGNRRRELEELSDGTLAQLLLAARIAFAEEVEQGQALPLFLDEALDQSDPVRFEAIVRSLGRVAREQGRQIIYLSADPLDVDRIRGALGIHGGELAEPIDLGMTRRRAASPRGPDPLRVEPRPPVPAPDNRSPEEYGVLLQVPAFRLQFGFGEQHLFYVLWDDLELLHALLGAGIERAGQWRMVAKSELAKRLAARDLNADQIGARIDLLNTFCELRQEGRGRPVDADALLDSALPRSKFFNDVADIAQEVDGDAARLLAVVESRQDPRLSGIRTITIQRLRNYLVENGYLDEREPLKESDLRLRALATPAANVLDTNLAVDCLHRWWRWANRSVPRGDPSAEKISV